jgi:flagellar protein FlaG
MSEITSSSNYNVSVGAEIVTPTTQKNQAQAVKVEKVEQNFIEEHAQRQEAIEQVKKEEEQKAVEEVASKLQEFVNLIDKKLQFSVDDKSGRHVVTVTDKLSGDVIRQIPSEEVLRLARNLSELAETANRSGKLILTEV